MDVAARFREYVHLDRKRAEGALAPRELQRYQALRRLLGRHFSPGTPEGTEDTRRSVRVPTRLKVAFATEGELTRSMMTNISRHGVFVETDHPQELKSRFELQIDIEDPPRRINVPVEVVSVGIGPGFEARKQGMGLRFLETDPETEAALRELYERAV